MYYPINITYGIWSRTRDYSGSTWTEWKRVDNFGCNTAADLASLLGVESGTFVGSKTFPESRCGILMMVEAGGGRSLAVYVFDAFTVTPLGTQQSFISSATVSDYALTVTANTSLKKISYTWLKMASLS